MLDATAAVCETLPEAVGAYAAAVRAGDAQAVIDHVQPSAVVYALENGQVRGLSRLAWKGRGAGPQPDFAAETVSAGERSAIVSGRWREGATARRDYTLWARLDCRWRIVGRVTGEDRPVASAASAGVGQAVDAKLAADETWSAEGLAQAVEPRALVIAVEDEQMAAASVAEWQARYAERRRQGTKAGHTILSRSQEGRGDLGAAIWTFASTTGGTYADRALLLRTAEGWRMLALLWVREH